ncbi:MAG: trigger factor [Planctomycetaceae bacterium]|nr:trigger factor [Planctomycetaceae bacterium]
MADNEQTPESTAVLDGAESAAPAPLDLKVAIEDAGPCRKHVKITVPRADLDRIFDEQVGDFVENAEVPGFRPGHVPTALIRKRFKSELADKVKQRVLMASLEQLADGEQIDPINEPNIDVDGIEIPDEGDFGFEFDVEVRPQFDLPNYKGLKIERPVRDISDADVAAYTQDYLQQYAHLVPVDEAAQVGDTVICDVEFTHKGESIRTFEELALKIRPTLRFYDAELEGFDKLMAGAKADDVREADLSISLEADRIEMRNETVHAKITVLDVKRLEMPAMGEEFFARVGAASEEDLREQFRRMLERQVQYEQRQATRDQVLDQITASADWELPEDLVRKQVENAMRRETLELRQAGFTDAEVRARETELRRNSLTTTRRNLKQHFILDRIVEQENLEVTGEDLDREITIMALQAGENPRRVRSRLIKSGVIENLEAQIRERKAVDLILESAKFTDKPLPPLTEPDVEGVNRSICGNISDTNVDMEEEEGEEA